MMTDFDIWTGLLWEPGTQQFRWINGEIPSWTHWSHTEYGEPNCMEGMELEVYCGTASMQNCVRMTGDGWKTHGCHQLHYVLCQKHKECFLQEILYAVIVAILSPLIKYISE